jgi:hypothetical protein
MNPADKIINALEGCNYAELIQVRDAAAARAKQMKADFKQKGEAMGLIKPRKPNGPKQHDTD